MCVRDREREGGVGGGGEERGEMGESVCCTCTSRPCFLHASLGGRTPETETYNVDLQTYSPPPPIWTVGCMSDNVDILLVYIGLVL